MLFNTIIFAYFFVLFWSMYWASTRYLWLQNLIVLVGSYVFYGWWDPRFLILIMVSTTTDYICALGARGRNIHVVAVTKSVLFLLGGSALVLSMDYHQYRWISLWVALYVVLGIGFFIVLRYIKTDARPVVFVTTSVVVNLSILGVFKYFNFFSDSLTSAFQAVGWSVDPITLSIVLPVGISFYTFQTMSYSLDSFRKKVEPVEELVPVAAYVAFFPQLVAGPIERAAHLLPQFLKRRTVSFEMVSSACWLFLWGLYKKVVVADNLAPIADRIFEDPAAYSRGELAVGLIAFTFQIYCDFSGYSDMARSLARALGFDVMVNFRLPYFSRTPAEFWKRWHISLSSWLRDYLYIPLGGSRNGMGKTYRNLSITMLLGGLWHGAQWHFVAWGAYQGLLLVGYRISGLEKFVRSARRRTLTKLAQDVVLWAAMFFAVTIGWLLFRAESMEQVGVYLVGLVTNRGASAGSFGGLAFYLAPLLILETLQRVFGKEDRYDSGPLLLRFSVRLFVIYSLMFLASSGGKQFIYFDF